MASTTALDRAETLKKEGNAHYALAQYKAAVGKYKKKLLFFFIIRPDDEDHIQCSPPPPTPVAMPSVTHGGGPPAHQTSNFHEHRVSLATKNQSRPCCESNRA